MLGPFGNIVAGVWLVIAPFMLWYPDAVARVTDVWTGLSVIAVSLVAATTGSNRLRYLTCALGVWLAAAPFLLGYRSVVATGNDLVIGFAIIAFSLLPVAHSAGASHASSRSRSRS